MSDDDRDTIHVLPFRDSRLRRALRAVVNWSRGRTAWVIVVAVVVYSAAQYLVLSCVHEHMLDKATQIEYGVSLVHDAIQRTEETCQAQVLLVPVDQLEIPDTPPLYDGQLEVH